MLITFAAIVLAGAAPAAEPSCLDKINDAIALANRMPPSDGRDVVMVEIARARDSLHENQADNCNEAIEETLALLRAQADASPAPGTGTGTTKP
jgi:hypothetical protein